jgi:hypothetical protein
MARISQMRVVALLLLCAGLAGCRTHNLLGGSSGSGNSSVVLAMTDSPPSLVTILSAKVTLTGAALNPGNISVFSGLTTVELTKLETDVAPITTATNVPAGTYTSVMLTFANLQLTIENDTNAPIGTPSCASSLICTITPTAPSMSVTIPLTAFTTVSGASAGLLVDVNLDNLLNSTMGADFQAGTTVSAFTPGGTGAPPVGAEDVVGQVSSVNLSSNTFTLQNAAASYSLKVDSGSTFLQFPSSATCMTQGFGCLQNTQIVSVDIGIQADGSLLARNIVFEDGDNSDTEVEGVVTNTNAGSQEFSIVTLAESAAVPNLNIGDSATVQYVVAPQTLFEPDFIHADSTPVSTGGFLFGAPTDLAVGQQVSIRRNAVGSSGTSGNVIIKADRIRLRSTRVTASVQVIGSSTMTLFNIPSIFSAHAVVDIQARTQQAICSENDLVIICSTIPVNVIVSARGPIFGASSARTMLATRVVEK